MNLEKIYKVIEGEPSYRKNQILKALCNGVSDWGEMTELPTDMRKKLEKEASLSISSASHAIGERSEKVSIVLKDGLKVETVLMKHKDRHTVCLSTQVGCPLGCLFCETGKMGFERNLTYSEIISQIIYFLREKRLLKIDNVVFMGMGEPFLNYDNLIEAIRIINHEDYFNLGARNISVSTSGIPEKIKRFADEGLQINLAISLHATDDSTRSKIMPINQTHPLKELFKAIDYYVEKTNRKVMFEYLLLDKINDTPEDARRLVDLLKHRLHFINLIRYNPTSSNFKPSSKKRVEEFKKILSKNNLNYGERDSMGVEIKGACGQLVTKNKS